MRWQKFYPWLNAVPQKFFSGIATLFFLGSLKAPGTWGSLAGVIFVWIVMSGLSLPIYFIVSLVLVYFAIGVCDIAERYFNLKDPGKINFDEFCAMPICYFGLLSNINSDYLWAWLLAGFALFRLFDITKPFGIKYVQSLNGGLGCVVDDVLAAIIVCAALNAFNIIF